jgi:branched-chain amino acid transport system substrate-binding protein
MVCYRIASAWEFVFTSGGKQGIPNQSGRGPIKIGFVTSLSGIGAPGGRDMVKAIKLFMEQIDCQIAGRPVELIIEDDQHSVAYAIDKLTKLVEEDGVHVLVGTISSNIAYGIASSVDAMKVPMIFPITGADDLTKRRRHKWVVRTGFSSSQYGLPFGEWARGTLGYSRVATFGLDYALGWEIVGSFQKRFEELGGELVQKIWASQALVDYSFAMRQLRPTADAVLFATSNTGADLVAKSYKQHGPGLPLIGGGPGFDESVLRDAGDSLLDAISVSHYSGALETEANLRFVGAYQDKYGAYADTSLFSEGAYVSGLWIKTAIESLNGEVEDRVKLLEALNKVELLDAPRGPIKLDQYGNPIQNIYVRKVERVDGKLQNTVIHTFESVSQFWNYDPVTFMKEPPFSKEYPPL